MNGSTADHLATAREVFERAKSLYLAKDLVGFAELFAADGVLELPFAPRGIPQRLQGRAVLREYFAAIADMPLQLTEFQNMTVYETTDPEVVIAEYDIHGQMSGTGRAYQLRVLQVMRVRDGQIVLSRDYSDPLASAEVLGRAPEPLERYSGGDRG